MAAAGSFKHDRTGGAAASLPLQPGSIDDDARQARDRLLRKVADDTDLPALGSSVARVVQLASSDDDSVRELAHFLLSDIALTQKVLRLANTVCYRTSSGVAITTISRAIFVLGFDTVKTSALAMLLVDGMKGKHAASVRNELGFALSASVIGREIARRSQFRDAEEGAVAALFKNMGRLLVAAHDHRLYTRIAELSNGGTVSPAQASTQVLGCSFDMLGESVLQEWGIPDTIVNALAPLAPGQLKPARNRQEWLQQVAAFSTTAAALIPKMTDPGEDAASKALLSRFGAAFNLDGSRLGALLATVARETRALTQHAHLQFAPENVEGAEDEDDVRAAAIDATEAPPDTLLELPLELPLELLMASPHAAAADERHPSGKPMQARDLLVVGVQDVTEMMASGRCKTNDLILLALETLYGAMGFRFATICLRDMKTNQFRARIALGADCVRLQQGFLFPVGGKRDLFTLSMENNADLMIEDATSPTILPLLPSWYRTLMPQVRSMIVLPLVVQKAPFGFFYADRLRVAPEGVPPDEAAMIRTLKGQVLAALGAR